MRMDTRDLPRTAKSFRIVLLIAIALMFLPTFSAQGSAAQADPPPGVWRLVSSDQSDTWQGDNFHGLKSVYTPFNTGSSMGATYTQYNIQFNANQPQTIASMLNGTCDWYWEGGSIPAEAVPGTNYPFSMAVNATATGVGYMWTVNGYTLTSQSSGSIAFAQVFLDTSQTTSGSQQTSGALVFSAGQTEGETHTVTQLCQVDIVSVQTQYNYVWEKGGCVASLALPDDMQPNEEFTPIVTVVDADNKPVAPQSEAWYYNGSASSKTMKWNGKAATVEYEYTCPGQSTSKTVSVNIPPAAACRASIVLPDKLEPDKEFTPRLEVLDLEGKTITPEGITWSYNGMPAASPMKWDGKEAVVKAEYVCPVDQAPGTASATIPAANPGGWITVVGGLAAVIAAGLAAVAVGIGLIRGGKKPDKNPPAPRFILQVDKTVVEVKPKESAALNIQAWRIKPDGSTVPASEAIIQVNVPQTPAGLAASPVSGVGSLRCLFSVPNPTVCADLTVTISARAGTSSTSATVLVKIVPVYELLMEWHDPSRTRLTPGEAEIYAWAQLNATPLPDAQTTPDQLAGKITWAVEGPNAALVELKTAPPISSPPYVKQGFLWIPVRALAPRPGETPQPGSPTLKAKFLGDKPPLEKSLTLDLGEDLVLGAWVQGKNQADVLYNRSLSTPAWDFSEIIAYFHRPDNDRSPANPSFEYQLTADCVTFDPPVLQVTDVYAHDRDQYTIRVELIPGTDLEASFGPDLCGLNGTIQVKLEVRAKNGGIYPAGAAYRLRPQLELFAHPEKLDGRKFKGLDLAADEFVADADDAYRVLVGCCRTDKPGPREVHKIEQVDPTWWEFTESLSGDSSNGYTPTRPADEGADERALAIQAQKPLLYAAGVETGALKLKIEGSLGSALPEQYLRTPLKAELDVKPLLPSLHLWVVPGKNRGTSEAWLMVHLGAERTRPLADTVIKVQTETVGGSGPQLLTNSLEHETSIVTGTNGSEQVNLVYSGLNWGNYQEALFTVSARLVKSNSDLESEAVKVAVNVKENVRQVLADLLARAEMLKLNNPYFENRSLGFTSLIDLTEYRPFVRGPVWNACEQFSGNESAYAKGDKRAKFAHDYVCSEFRDRVAAWLVRRRHYQAGNAGRVEEIARMNGIEFDNFIVASGFHNYEALFLSGMAPTDDPRGVDPWWKQSWKDEAYLEPDGLISNNWERYYAIETAAWLTVALTPVAVGTFLYTGGAGTAIFIESLGPIIAAYAAGTAGELSDDRMYENGQYAYRGAHKYVGREMFIKDWTAEGSSE